MGRKPKTSNTSAAAVVVAAASSAPVDEADPTGELADQRDAAAELVEVNSDPSGAAQIDANPDPLKEHERPVAVEITGPVQGRWRISSNPRKFTAEPTILLLADLSDADLLELHGDPELTVRTLTALPQAL